MEMSRSRDEIGCSVASVTGKCSLHACVSLCSDWLFFVYFRRLHELCCSCVVRLIKIYHEGKICLTVHFRGAYTSDGTGLASWWNQIYHEGKICLTVHFRGAYTSDGTGLASWWNQVRVVHGGLSWVLVGGWRRL
ncbi:hypothetical protein VPH35_065632 [Triticum aestivum]